ncbi:hypothetical protein D9M70_584240 [compost metagenome]
MPSGVNTAVQVMLSVVARPVKVPPTTVMSLASKPATASLNVKLMLASSPAASARSSVVIARVGAVASTVTVPVTGVETLPATSVAVTLTVCGPSASVGKVLSARVQVPSPLLVAG